MKSTRSRRRNLPKPLIFMAFGCALFGAYTHWQERLNAHERQLALTREPPAIVAIEGFSEEKNLGPAREVRVTAQVDFSLAQRLEILPLLDGPAVVMVPLLPVGLTEADIPDAAGLALLRDVPATFDNAQLELLLGDTVGMGALGPIVELHGTITGQGLFRPLIYKAFWQGGRSLQPGALVLEPLAGPRSVALESQAVGASALLYGGTAIALILLAILLIAHRKGKAAREARAPLGYIEIAPYAPEFVGTSSTRPPLHDLIVPNAAGGRRATPEEPYSPRSNVPVESEVDVQSVQSTEKPRTIELVSTTPLPNSMEYLEGEAVPLGKYQKHRREQDLNPFCHVRLGPSIREEIKLSKRATAQLNADPFIQRLARMS